MNNKPILYFSNKMSCKKCGYLWMPLKKGVVRCPKCHSYHNNKQKELTTDERFLSFINVKENGCWEWTGQMHNTGYGVFNVHSEPILSHRFSYEYFNKTTIPECLELDHLCRNRICCNPDHLEAVTRQINIQRGIGHNRVGSYNSSKTKCHLGHPFSKENTYIRANGGRECRICRAIAAQKCRDKKKQGKRSFLDN